MCKGRQGKSIPPIAGDVVIEAALEQLVAYMPSSYLKEHIERVVSKLDNPRVPAVEHRSEVPVLYILEVEGDGLQCLNVGCVIRANERLTISNAEILQCHTFTKCFLLTIVPPGFTVSDLCTPPESYRVHSFHSLGTFANKDDLGTASQAYAVGSAAGPALAEEKDNVVGTADSIPTSVEVRKQPAEDVTDEQVTTTLAWTSRSTEKMLSPEQNGQQPIVPTRRDLPTLDPVAKKEQVLPVKKSPKLRMTRMWKWRILTLAKNHILLQVSPSMPPILTIQLKVMAATNKEMTAWKLTQKELGFNKLV